MNLHYLKCNCSGTAFLRARAIARISYGNSVLVSCHNPVPIGAQVRQRLLVFTI